MLRAPEVEVEALTRPMHCVLAAEEEPHTIQAHSPAAQVEQRVAQQAVLQQPAISQQPATGPVLAVVAVERASSLLAETVATVDSPAEAEAEAALGVTQPTAALGRVAKAVTEVTAWWW